MDTSGSPESIVPRHDDLCYLAHCILHGECCALVGLSNVGKSTVLRTVARTEFRRDYLTSGHAMSASPALIAYLDCNMIAEMSEQGFYELILRRLVAEAGRLQLSAEITEQLELLYQQVINPRSRLVVPLSLNHALALLVERAERQVVLLLDEFDSPFEQLQARDLLNLRALRDKHAARLVYVTATDLPLRRLRQEPEVDEFNELFAHRTRVLGLLSAEEANWLIHQFAAEEHPRLTSEDERFIWQQAGGHPGLLAAVCRVMVQTMRPGDAFWRIQEYRTVRAQLEEDVVVHAECAKLWGQLSEEEQSILISLDRKQAGSVPRSLMAHGIVRDGAIFGQLFRGFVHRQGLIHDPRREGIRMDVESGHVWVEGQLIPPLTELEYRLLLLLYGRLDEICTKDQVAQAVWGTDYLEAVDDARIDKLVSRLRQRIEPDPGEPRYLVTIRGRGYQLVRP